MDKVVDQVNGCKARRDFATRAVGIFLARTNLCDTKRDVADVQPTGLPGHLTAHDWYWGGCDSQAIGSHGGQEGCGWNLSRSWRGRKESKNSH